MKTHDYLKKAKEEKRAFNYRTRKIKNLELKQKTSEWNSIRIQGKRTDSEDLEFYQEMVIDSKEQYHYYMKKYVDSKVWVFSMFQKPLKNYITQWQQNMKPKII